MRITTDRLEIIAATVELITAEIHDRRRLAELLDAPVPDSWPPEFNDVDSMTWTLNLLSAAPGMVGWASWYYVLRKPDRLLIGNGGFKGSPTADGVVEIGYGIVKEQQRKGYATEAVAGQIAWAFQHPEVRAVIAETYPEIIGSVRVMQKNGLVFDGEGSEERSIRYRRVK